MHTCTRCLKSFVKKSNYLAHLNRKFPCNNHENNSTLKLINSEISLNNNITTNNNICPKCNKKFYHKGNVKVHLEKSCKVIKNEQQLIVDAVKKLLLNQANINTNINITNNNIDNSTTNNNNINTTNNIQVNIYSAGKEDLSRLSHEDVIKICTSGTYYPIVAAEIIHCNKNYPEFQNFLISNLRSSTGLVYSNDNWISKSQDEILTNLMKIDKKHVSDLIKDLKVDNKLKVKLESTKQEIDDNECKEHQKPKIKEKLYNVSKMVLKTKKTNNKVLGDSKPDTSTPKK